MHSFPSSLSKLFRIITSPTEEYEVEEKKSESSPTISPCQKVEPLDIHLFLDDVEMVLDEAVNTEQILEATEAQLDNQKKVDSPDINLQCFLQDIGNLIENLEKDKTLYAHHYEYIHKIRSTGVII